MRFLSTSCSWLGYQRDTAEYIYKKTYSNIMNVGCKLGFDRLFTVDYLIYGIHGKQVWFSVLIMSSVIVFFVKTLL